MKQAQKKEILEKFWNTVKSYREIITFNGRGFDCPFILIRSAVHKIKPTKDLMPNRYNGTHIDLLDQLTFYGASRRRFSLDMWCKTFGIKSPKEEGITGYDIKTCLPIKGILILRGIASATSGQRKNCLATGRII